jgi:hypothetical protein
MRSVVSGSTVRDRAVSVGPERDKAPDQEFVRRANGTAVLIFTFRDRPDDEQIAWFKQASELMLKQTTPFAIIMDMRWLTQMSAKQRAQYATERSRVRAVFAMHKVVTVYVFRDNVQLGFLTAIGWIAEPSATSGREFRESLEEAKHFCLTALDRHVGGF